MRKRANIISLVSMFVFSFISLMPASANTGFQQPGERHNAKLAILEALEGGHEYVKPDDWGRREGILFFDDSDRPEQFSFKFNFSDDFDFKYPECPSDKEIYIDIEKKMKEIEIRIENRIMEIEKRMEQWNENKSGLNGKKSV